MEEVMLRFSSHDLGSPSDEEGVDPPGGWVGSISCSAPQASEDPSEGCWLRQSKKTDCPMLHPAATYQHLSPLLEFELLHDA